MPWRNVRGAEYGEKLYREIASLNGTDYLLAYDALFPGDIIADPDTNPNGYKLLEGRYRILSDRKNRELMVALCRRRNPTRDELAEATGLKVGDISERLEFFRANGMRQIRIRNAA